MDCPFTLPPHGQEIYREVFDNAKANDATDMEAVRRAWKVVKHTYRRKGDRWLRKKPPKGRVAVRGRNIKTPHL